MKNITSVCAFSLRNVALFFAMAWLAGGCANLEQRSDCNCPNKEKVTAAPKKELTLGEQRQILSEGYSLLYRDASSLNLTQMILYAKEESAQVKEIVTAVAEFAGKLEKELERIDRDYPGVRIDLDPLPVMEQRKRAAIAKDRVIEFAPGVGKGGRDYERTVLIGLSNGINHERHLCEVMAKEEPDPNLKKFLLDTKQHYDGLYDRIDVLLEKDYFKS